MAPTESIPRPPPTSLLPKTPPSSPAHTPPDSSQVHISTPVVTVHRLEEAIVKLQELEKLDATNEREDANPEVTKHVEAEKPKTRVAK